MKKTDKTKFELMKEYSRFQRKNYPCPPEQVHRYRNEKRMRKLRVIDIEDDNA